MHKLQFKRRHHFSRVFLKPMRAWILVGGYGFIGTCTWFRDEFLSSEIAAKYHIPTILAYLATFGAGWWIAGFLFCCVVIIFEASYREYVSMHQRFDQLAETLEKIGQDRAFEFDSMGMDVAFLGGQHGWAGSKRIDYERFKVTAVKIYFKNIGSHMIQYSIRNFWFDIGGTRINFPDDLAGGYVGAGQDRYYTGTLESPVEVEDMPVVIRLHFDFQYDNVPPILKRGSEQEIEYIYKSFDPMKWENVIKYHKEYFIEK